MISYSALTAFQNGVQNLVQEVEATPLPNDSKALKAHLEVLYEKVLRSQLNDFQKSLQSLGIETVMGSMNIRVAVPPLLASASALLNFPPVNPVIVGAGAIAFSVIPVIQQKRKEAKQMVKSSPAAYLFYTREGLQPGSIVASLRQYTRRWLFGV